MAKYCPLIDMALCVSNCAFYAGENCLIAEALKNYNKLNSPLMSFYIDEGAKPTPKEAE